MYIKYLRKIIAEAKMIITTISFMVASVIGGYQIVTRYFVTKVYAKEMILSVTKQIDELKEQTLVNRHILTEMRLIRLESKLSRGEVLTPTEVRIYEKLKEDYKKIK